MNKKYKKENSELLERIDRMKRLIPKDKKTDYYQSGFKWYKYSSSKQQYGYKYRNIHIKEHSYHEKESVLFMESVFNFRFIHFGL